MLWFSIILVEITQKYTLLRIKCGYFFRPKKRNRSQKILRSQTNLPSRESNDRSLHRCTIQRHEFHINRYFLLVNIRSMVKTLCRPKWGKKWQPRRPRWHRTQIGAQIPSRPFLQHAHFSRAVGLHLKLELKSRRRMLKVQRGDASWQWLWLLVDHHHRRHWPHPRNPFP